MTSLRYNKGDVIVQFDINVPVREVRIMNSMVKGSLVGSEIKFAYTENSLKLLLSVFESKDMMFEVDDFLSGVLQDIGKKEDEFEKFSHNALIIKNNPENAGSDFAEFLRVIEGGMDRKLYDFQSRAAFHMAYSLNSCNFSVPGTGKTSIVYGAYTYLKEQGIVDRLLVVGPLSSFGPWKNEYFECFKRKPKLVNLSSMNHTSKRNYLTNHTSLQSEITFINYEGFSSLVNSMKLFVKNSRVMVVLDEAHKIKNPNSLRANNVLEFSLDATSKVILTGTPIPNGYKDLYNLFKFIWPTKNIIGFNANTLSKLSEVSNSKALIKTLMGNIDPYYVRIRKSYLNLPEPVFHEPIPVPMGDVQQKIYDFIAEDFLNQDISFEDVELQMKLKKSKIMRLMQSITNPSNIAVSLDMDLDADYSGSTIYELIKNYNEFEIPPKFNYILELTEEIIKRGEKVIIWSIFTNTIHSLRSFLESNEIKVEVLYGEVDNERREEIIDEFHINNELKVIIANPAAVAESISLHKICNNAIYLDKSFNAAHYMQSKDRIHRVGLKKDSIVNYYFLLSRNTIDEVIHDRVLKKEKVMLDVIEGNVVPLFDQDFGSEMSQIDIDTIENYLRGKFR